MYKTISFSIRSVAPLLMHNARLIDPMNPLVKAIKKLTDKKTKKTEVDIEEIARLEFTGGLYLDGTGAPAIPEECIEAMIRDGAKKTRKGKDVQSGILCQNKEGGGCFPLVYEGPKTVDELWGDGHTEYVSMVPVKVGQARIMRCRPIFRSWELTFSLDYLPSVVNKSNIEEWLVTAGQICGIGDRRPRYGRFEVL